MAGLINNFNWAVNNQQNLMKLNNQYNQSFYNIPHYDVLIYGHIVISAFTRLPPSTFRKGPGHAAAIRSVRKLHQCYNQRIPYDFYAKPVAITIGMCSCNSPECISRFFSQAILIPTLDKASVVNLRYFM